jgi:hypothetical protein
MLTLRAAPHQDGSVGGHAVFRDRAANTKVDMDIDCPVAAAHCGLLRLPGARPSEIPARLSLAE